MMNNPAVRYGLIAGAIITIILLIIYIIESTAIFNGWIGTALFVIMIIAMILAAKEEKKLSSEYFSYKKALKTTFLTYVIIAAISTIFMAVLFYLLDPELKEYEKSMYLDESVKGMSARGLSDDDIEKQMPLVEKIYNLFYNPFAKFALSCIIGFIVALIVSIFLKEKKPQITA